MGNQQIASRKSASGLSQSKQERISFQSGIIMKRTRTQTHTRTHTHNTLRAFQQKKEGLFSPPMSHSFIVFMLDSTPMAACCRALPTKTKTQAENAALKAPIVPLIHVGFHSESFILPFSDGKEMFYHCVFHKASVQHYWGISTSNPSNSVQSWVFVMALQTLTD